MLPESIRERIVADIRENSIDWLNAKPLTDKSLRQLFRDEEFADYTEAFREAWLSDIPSVYDEFARYSSNDEISLYTDFKDNLQAAQAYFKLEDNDEFRELYRQIDARIEELEAEQTLADDPIWSPSSTGKFDADASDSVGAIFRDVDA